METRFGRIRVQVNSEISSAMNHTERLWAPSLKQLVMNCAARMSIGDTYRTVNGFLCRDDHDSIRKRTIEDTVQQEGRKISSAYQSMLEEILPKYGFDPITGKLKDSSALPDEMKVVEYSEARREEMRVKIEKACEKINSATEREDYQIKPADVINEIEVVPADAVVVCTDEVGVSHQKEKRSVNNLATVDDHKNVETTVTYIRSREGTYRLTGDTVHSSLMQTLGFLLYNNLLAGRNLLFFTDGARNLKSEIEALFGFREFTLNLDWYHLEKKCYESFTMALTGGKANFGRNEQIRAGFFGLLWLGKVDTAKEYLKSISPKAIKNQKQIDAISDYLDRKGDNIYCFALRKELGLTNASNQGEKSNDIIVASRQKHNGMSWCDSGSKNMGNISLVISNQEDTQWYTRGQLLFKMTPLSWKASEQMGVA